MPWWNLYIIAIVYNELHKVKLKLECYILVSSCSNLTSKIVHRRTNFLRQITNCNPRFGVFNKFFSRVLNELKCQNIGEGHICIPKPSNVTLCLEKK